MCTGEHVSGLNLQKSTDVCESDQPSLLMAVFSNDVRSLHYERVQCHFPFLWIVLQTSLCVLRFLSKHN